MVQGHPKLLEVTDGFANDPARLTAHLDQATAEWGADAPTLQRFFEEGRTALDTEKLQGALDTWTHRIAAELPEAARTLFFFLCCLEEDDRNSFVVGDAWGDLWTRLGRPGSAPDLGETLAPLTTVAMVDAQPVGQDGAQYAVHPVVAEAGRDAAGPEVQAAVDEELAGFWRAGFELGQQEERRGGGRLMALAGFKAAPYLVRRQAWHEAALLIERALPRDPSRANVAQALAWLEPIVAATVGTSEWMEHAGVLGKLLALSGRPDEAAAMLRQALDQAVTRQQYDVASATAGELVTLLGNIGAYDEALKLVERMTQYTKDAGLGPWTQLADRGHRLQILNRRGDYQEVLDEARWMRRRMASLPEAGGVREVVIPWNVRETVLDIAREAALQLGRWEEALALNAERLRSARRRNATTHDLALARFNSVDPFLRLGRLDKAGDVLATCRATFEEHPDDPNLGRVYKALGDLEHALGHLDQAVAFARLGLPYGYLEQDPASCAVRHLNLSAYLQRAGHDRKVVIGHRLAAGVICLQTQDGHLDGALRDLAFDLVEFAPDLPPLPASFEDLCEIVEQEDGVRFRELFEGLPRVEAGGDAAMRMVIESAQARVPEIVAELERLRDEQAALTTGQARPRPRGRRGAPSRAGRRPSARRRPHRRGGA